MSHPRPQPTAAQRAATTRSFPWPLVAGALATVVFAVAVVGYAIHATAGSGSASALTAKVHIPGLQTYQYAAGQQHTTAPVDYAQSPPVGGPHDPEWADCTGTVYTVDIRHENAVHSLEHGAVWITYDPTTATSDDVATLAALVGGHAGLMLSPYQGQASPFSVQSWNRQMTFSAVNDPGLSTFITTFALGSDAQGQAYYPEPGASCENPTFIDHPLVEGQGSRAGSTAAGATMARG